MKTDASLPGEHHSAEDEDGVRSTLSAVERERLADEREADLDERETRAAVRQAESGARIEGTVGVLADAATRDARADERDARADARERAASLDAFLHPDADHYGAIIRARRASAIDRSEAKSDRASSAADRSKLTDT